MALPPNMPEAGGKDVIMTCFVDAGHAHNQKDRRSRTGILIFVNKAPIHWYSKRENTVETITFGAEFCAIKTLSTWLLRLLSTSIPESVLKKKHHSIANPKSNVATEL